MKYCILSFMLILLAGCKNSSDVNSGELVINKNLQNKFFEQINYGVYGPANDAFSDSISGDETNIEFYTNANVVEISGTHHSFDTCKSFFMGKTLIIEFRSISPFDKDKIKLRIKNNKYSGVLIEGDSNKEYVGLPKSLVFKNKIIKPGQEIFGELALDISDPITNKKYSFKGPFRCVVE